MRSNFDKCMEWVFKSEGGYVNHPRDPGGATNMGITIGTLKAWRKPKAVTEADVKNLTKAEAKEIYYTNFWKPSGADNLPSGLDYMAFDIAVNHGVGRVKQILVVKPHNVIQSINETKAKRQRFYERLSTFSTFGRGWTARNNEVTKKALEMHSASSKDAMPLQEARSPVQAPKAPQTTTLPPTPTKGLWERLKGFWR